MLLESHNKNYIIKIKSNFIIYMFRYRFKQSDGFVILYSCPICRYIHEWNDEWDEIKKEEVKVEVETHYNYHIITQS